jgi:hypothetical protein
MQAVALMKYCAGNSVVLRSRTGTETGPQRGPGRQGCDHVQRAWARERRPRIAAVANVVGVGRVGHGPP